MTAASTRRVTISFSVPSTVHLIAGLVLAAAAIVAYVLHFTLPLDDPYRNTAASIGNLASFVTVGYCMLCVSRGNRADTAELAESTDAATTAAAKRQEEIRSILVAATESIRSTLEAATTAILLSLREIAEQQTDDRGALKQLEEAVNGATEAVAEAIGAVEALQDCYLAEGQALILPAIETPRDRTLIA